MAFDLEVMAKRSLEQAQMRLRREMAKKCDWQDAEDVALYRRDKRRKLRQVQLDLLVPQRRCPCCNEIRLGPKQWVVNADQTVICCLSCYREAMPARGEIVSVKEEYAHIFRPVIRYEIDGHKLRELRIKLGISMSALGKRCGWSAAFQLKLEEKTASVNGNIMRLLLQELQRAGAIFVNPLPTGKGLSSEFEATITSVWRPGGISPPDPVGALSQDATPHEHVHDPSTSG